MSSAGVVSWFGLIVLGALGALARVEIDRAVSARVKSALPLGIIAVNGSGALLAGFATGLALSPWLLAVVGVGFLGGYTTFSTWMTGAQRLAADGRYLLAMVNVLVPAFGGLALTVLGLLVGRGLAGG
ncbi:MAG: fluoride efflux transporter CrcB [Thermoleophilaceae bacterium]